MLAEFYSIADYSTTARRIQILFCGRLLGLTPATRRYNAHCYAVNNHEVTTLTKRNRERDTRRDTRSDTLRIPGGAIGKQCAKCHLDLVELEIQ